MRPLLVFLSLVLALAAPAAEPPPAASPPPPFILTTFLPVHSIATSLAAQDARVENWLPAGIDPHDFQFSARDLRRLRDARVLIAGGLGLESWDQARLRRISGNPTLQLLEASAGIPTHLLIAADPNAAKHDHGPDHDHDHDHHHGAGPNPHFWLDPLLMRHAVTNVWMKLVELNPEKRSSYDARARGYLERLDRLHAEFESGLAVCRSTAFITYHDAFPYLARRYQLNLAGVVETSAAEEPSARELAALYQKVRQQGVKVLFTDGPAPRLARRISADLNLRLASLETLETGTLAPEAYEAGMRRNLATLRTALAPSLP
ncbi:MAG: zinc ABC transporter substrate-binding protein [Verrucomicrobiales bacterium]|nr:zinc ABC transporter substrate-binding protein [Verrucomicrobiales bacterium]